MDCLDFVGSVFVSIKSNFCKKERMKKALFACMNHELGFLKICGKMGHCNGLLKMQGFKDVKCIYKMDHNFLGFDLLG